MRARLDLDVRCSRLPALRRTTRRESSRRRPALAPCRRHRCDRRPARTAPTRSRTSRCRVQIATICAPPAAIATLSTLSSTSVAIGAPVLRDRDAEPPARRQRSWALTGDHHADAPSRTRSCRIRRSTMRFFFERVAVVQHQADLRRPLTYYRLHPLPSAAPGNSPATGSGSRGAGRGSASWGRRGTGSRPSSLRRHVARCQLLATGERTSFHGRIDAGHHVRHERFPPGGRSPDGLLPLRARERVAVRASAVTCQPQPVSRLQSVAVRFWRATARGARTRSWSAVRPSSRPRRT